MYRGELERETRAGSACLGKNVKTCTSCPKPRLVKGKGSKTHKGKGKGKGKGGKRSPEADSLDPRAEIKVGMDAIGWGNWEPTDYLLTVGLGGCTTMAVYNQDGFVMSHIPPSREGSKNLDQMIDEYIERMEEKYNEMGGLLVAKGYLLVIDILDQESITRL